MKSSSERIIRKIEVDSSSSLQFLLLQTSTYTDPSGEVCTLDIVKTFKNGALIVDCTSDGAMFDPNNRQPEDTRQEIIKKWETAKINTESLEMSQNPDVSSFPASVYARLDHKYLTFKVNNSGGIFAIEQLSSRDPNFSYFGVEVHPITLIADQEQGKDHNEFRDPEVTPVADGGDLLQCPRYSNSDISTRSTIGFILVTDGVYTVLDEEKKFRFGGSAEDIARSVSSLLNKKLSVSGDNPSQVFKQFKENLSKFYIPKEPHDDLTILVVLEGD